MDSTVTDCSLYFQFINLFQNVHYTFELNISLAMPWAADMPLNIVTFMKRQGNVGNVNPFLLLYIRSAIRPVSGILCFNWFLIVKIMWNIKKSQLLHTRKS